MFAEVPLDPTAGERARQIRAFPHRPQPILDPTDPRNGVVVPGAGPARNAEHEATPEREPVADPFDPEEPF
jgi:hypothetical protein